MKSVQTLELLNNEFVQVQTGERFNTGSITPRTTTKKVVLDRVEISQDAKELYEKSIREKLLENYSKLGNDFEQNQKKFELLNGLIQLEMPQSKDYKTYNEKLASVNNEIILGQEKIELIEKSKSIEIKEFGGFGFETIYQEDIEGANFLNKDTPGVLRYGLNTESKALDDIVDSCIEKGVLHPYEEAIFQKAFEYLDIVESADSYINAGDRGYYPNNIVLIDIFDRSKGFINSGNNQTHTIALWKKKNNEVVLIDPSNVSFSSDISKTLKIKSLSIPGNQIYFPGNNKTGYSDYSKILPSPRDCIDIAVKIGFELNELQKQQINIQDIENNLLANIANTKAANKLIRAIGLDQCHVRELQGSNQAIRILAKKTIIDDGNFIKSMSRLDSLVQYQKVSEIIKNTNIVLESFGIKICPTKDIPIGKITI